MYKAEFTVIEYQELDDLMKKEFNLSSFESSFESSNDTCYIYNNITKEPLDEWDQEKFNKIIKNKHCEYYFANNLIQELINRDVLPEGNYIFRVNW